MCRSFENVTTHRNSILRRLTPIPKGGCNAGTIYGGTTKDAIKAKLKADYQEVIVLIESEFSSSCSATKTAIQSLIASDSSIDSYAQSGENMLKYTRFYVVR